MGITGSKVAQEDKEDVTAGSVPTTPILTPKVKKTVEELVDPRSPSCSIIRTPIVSVFLSYINITMLYLYLIYI